MLRRQWQGSRRKRKGWWAPAPAPRPAICHPTAACGQVILSHHNVSTFLSKYTRLPHFTPFSQTTMPYTEEDGNSKYWKGIEKLRADGSNYTAWKKALEWYLRTRKSGETTLIRFIQEPKVREPALPERMSTRSLQEDTERIRKERDDFAMG